MVQFMCSYLPGTIADKCEEFVDEYGQKVIDAIVHEELKPTEVCSQVFPDCGEARSVECVWGPSYWCATPFHARVCGTTQICKVEHFQIVQLCPSTTTIIFRKLSGRHYQLGWRTEN